MQHAKSVKIQAEFDACLKGYYAKHPDRSGANAAVISLDEALGLKDHTGAPIPCSHEGQISADETVEADQKYSALARQWRSRLAVALLLGFSAPWVWRFLLRRVAELGAAFRGGKPPI